MKRILIVLFCWSGILCIAQPPSKFICRYGGDGVDIGYSVKQTYNKSYVIIGSTTSFGAGGTDAYMLMVDSMGNLTWQKTFGGIGNEVGKSIVINPIDSGFIFTGFTNSIGFGGYDIYVVRCDKNGSKIWERNFGGNDWEFGVDLCFMNDGNILVGGNAPSLSNNSSNDCVIMKLDVHSGNLIWQKRIGGSENENLKRTKRTKDGLVTVLFDSNSYGDTRGDIILYKIGLSGDSVSSKIIGLQNKIEHGYDFIEDKNNDLVICGDVDTSSAYLSTYQCFVLKTTMTGSIIVEQKFGGAGNEDRFYSIADIQRGNKYYFSRRVLHPPFGIDVQPVVLDYSLSFNSSVTYGSSGIDEAFQVIATTDNGSAMVGRTQENNDSNDDVFFVKLDSTVHNTNGITNIKVNKNTISDLLNIYCNKNLVYFNETLNNCKFNLIDQSGQIVETGKLIESPLNLFNLKEGQLYMLNVLTNYNLVLKFVAE